jgi:hypothetical protein
MIPEKVNCLVDWDKSKMQSMCWTALAMLPQTSICETRPRVGFASTINAGLTQIGKFGKKILGYHHRYKGINPRVNIGALVRRASKTATEQKNPESNFSKRSIRQHLLCHRLLRFDCPPSSRLHSSLFFFFGCLFDLSLLLSVSAFAAQKISGDRCVQPCVFQQNLQKGEKKRKNKGKKTMHNGGKITFKKVYKGLKEK